MPGTLPRVLKSVAGAEYGEGGTGIDASEWPQAWLKCPTIGCTWGVQFGCEVGSSKEMALRKLTNHHLYDHTYLKERQDNSSAVG
jgi:hypothetical protein